MKNKLKFVTILSSAIFFAIDGANAGVAFSNTFVIGDSNSDSGRYINIPAVVGDDATKAGANQGAFTTNPGKEWVGYLAGRFGYSSNPWFNSNGATNYAAGSAQVEYEDPTLNAWSGQSQVTQLLADNGGRLDPNALYTVWIGINDLKTNSNTPIVDLGVTGNRAAVTDLGLASAALVEQMRAAGAQYFIVPSTPALTSVDVNDPALGLINAQKQEISLPTAARQLYDQTVWSRLHSQGINFIPADLSAVINYAFVNHNQFGITTTGAYFDAANDACGVNISYQCTVDPAIASTYFWADVYGHLATTVQVLEADYTYSLIVAPSQVSMIAESALSYNNNLVTNYQAQIQLSNDRKKVGSFNTWITGSYQRQQIKETDGFNGQNANPTSVSAGLDYKISQNSLVGVALGNSQSKFKWTTEGNYTQSNSSLSLYSAYDNKKAWATAIATYTRDSNNVNRNVALGIATLNNNATASGSVKGIALQGGYKWNIDSFSHGPVVGFNIQKVNISGFREEGSITSLAFDAQTRNSDIGQLGYQADLEIGKFKNFAKFLFNREFANTKRNVVANITTVASPSYYMPAISLGKKWESLYLGTSYKISEQSRAFGMFSSQFSQKNASNYATTIGYSYSF